MGIISNLSAHIYMFTVPIKEKSSECVVQAYLSDILAQKGRGVAMLSDNDVKFKNKVLNKVYNQLHFIHKVMQKWKMYIIS